MTGKTETPLRFSCFVPRICASAPPGRLAHDVAAKGGRIRPPEEIAQKLRQTACKPGSVRPLPGGMTIPLECPSPGTSRDRPGRRRGNAPAGCPACHPYLVLLPVGFAVPGPLPAPRCALAAPFHPCPASCGCSRGRRSVFCGTFPGVAPAGRYPAPCFRGARTFLTRRCGHPADWRALCAGERGPRQAAVLGGGNLRIWL